VWSLTGLWHGASWNFLLWGVYYAALLIIEKVFLLKWLEKLPAVGNIYTLGIVTLGWALFSIESTEQLLPYLRAMFGGNGLVSSDALYWLRNYAVMFAVMVFAATPLPSKVIPTLSAYKYIKPVLILLALILCTATLVDSSYNPFLYFRF
jgi:alginate O-acetyltransferase complex protein AlgI